MNFPVGYRRDDSPVSVLFKLSEFSNVQNPNAVKKGCGMSMVFSEIPYESHAFFPLIGCFETVKYSLDELLFFVSCETEKKLHKKSIVISVAVDFFLLILLQPGSMQLFQPCLISVFFLEWTCIYYMSLSMCFTISMCKKGLERKITASGVLHAV